MNIVFLNKTLTSVALMQQLTSVAHICGPHIAGLRFAARHAVLAFSSQHRLHMPAAVYFPQCTKEVSMFIYIRAIEQKRQVCQCSPIHHCSPLLEQAVQHCSRLYQLSLEQSVQHSVRCRRLPAVHRLLDQAVQHCSRGIHAMMVHLAIFTL